MKGGTIHGATDELGFASVENTVSVPDWHATVLHLFGLDYEQLHFLRNGLEERLTGVFAPAWPTRSWHNYHMLGRGGKGTRCWPLPR